MRTRLIAVLVSLASAAALLAFAGSAVGIVGGTADTTTPYKYPSVGMIEIYGFFGNFWMPACSGTLIAPNVVLTAGHCTLPAQVGLIAPSDVRITFDPAPQSIYFPGRPASTHYTVAGSFTDPDYLASNSPKGNSKAGFGQVSVVGVLVLADSVAAGVATPMPVVGAGALDGLKSTLVRAVGYGYNGFLRGAFGTPSSVPDYNGLRNYADATVLTDHDTVSGLFLKTTSVSCAGDSGGPLFLDGKVAAVTSFGESYHCSSPDYWTRLDTVGVQEFLAGFLGDS